MTGIKRRSRMAAGALVAIAALLGAGCTNDGSADGDTPGASGTETEGTPQSDVTTEADLNGKYRYVITEEDADEAGVPPEPGLPHTTTITLTDGELEGGCFGAEGGTYVVEGDEITFDSREYDPDVTVTFSVDGEGNLHLEPVPPIDPGAAFTCFYKPWMKIG